MAWRRATGGLPLVLFVLALVHEARQQNRVRLAGIEHTRTEAI